MKAFYSLVLLIFLTSCSSEAPVVGTLNPITPVQEVVTEIDETVEALPEVAPDTQEIVDTLIEEVNSVPLSESDDKDENVTPTWSDDLKEEEQVGSTFPSKVVELETTYNNPKMEVMMNIEYSLDSDDKISEISVTSKNYPGMPDFNTWIQAVVWMTVEEASEYVVSGSSLTTPAFQGALKETL